MPIIGTFSAVKDGYAGSIRTLTMSVRVRLVANDRKEPNGAPDFRILVGAAEIGAAWRRTRKGTDEPYRVREHGQASPTLKYRQPKKHPSTTVLLCIFKHLDVRK
jgi:uncharacterized protein (DUF736 family)